MVVEEPTVKGTLVKGFANEKSVLEASVAENTFNKEMDVDSPLVKLLGIEEL